MEIFKVTILACLAAATLLSCGVKAQDTDCSAIANLTDIEIFLLEGQLVVVWQEPENLYTCDFEDVFHNVTYSGYDSEQDITTSDFYAYFDYYPYRCVPSVITITIISNDLSTTATVEYYTETSEVDDLTLEEADNGTLVATWSEPEDSEYCNFIYLVTYEDENSNTVTIETTDLEADFGIALSSCILATVTVTPVNGDYVGVASRTDYEGDINPVRNYELTSAIAEIIAQFDPPLGIEYCNITYEVREIEDDCYRKNVSVAAFNGRIYSEWMSDTIEVEIASLTGVSATVEDDSIVVSWTAPSDADTCSVTYQVVVDGTTYTTTDSSLTVLAATVEACSSLTISVSGVSSSGKVGIASEVVIQGELGSIENLALESGDDTVTASWDAPENSSSCSLSYLLEYTNESGSHIYVTTANTYSFEYESCVDVSLSITPYSEDGSEGAKTTATLEASC